VEQLAKRWRLPPATVERLAKQGEIPFQYVRQEFIFLESAIERWEEERERKLRQAKS
jgi:Helix-turn-helix domain